MKFYDRKNDLRELELLHSQTNKRSIMTVLTGRRRIGKTTLVKHFSKDKNYIYLFISKKDEHLLCEELAQEIKRYSDFPLVGKITQMQDIFTLLFEIARQKRVVVVFDEFQEFYKINKAVFSELQNLWDSNKNKAKMFLILTGSLYSMMIRIFQNSKEPLFGRADRLLILKPFSIPTIAKILKENNTLDEQNLFNYFVFTGGMPKYLELLVSNSLFNFDDILNFMIRENSPFLDEGKYLLIEEFGKEYGIYFSILELIARGKTGRTEIESYLQKKIGGYLDRLEKDYSVIESVKPINAKPNSKKQKYRIKDNFLNFWFRFIYRNRSAIEIGNYEYVKDLIKQNYNTYSGRILELFYKEIFGLSGEFNKIGSYWERNNKNEIDIVAINENKKKMLIAEIKLKSSNINLEILKNKAAKLLLSYPDYQVEWKALSLENIIDFIKA